MVLYRATLNVPHDLLSMWRGCPMPKGVNAGRKGARRDALSSLSSCWCIYARRDAATARPVVQLPRDPSNITRALVAAFPTRLAGDVLRVLAVMPEASSAPMMPFEVEVQGETVAIPSRIEEPGAGFERVSA